jgi:c-di-GMP-binding flagellar brake protein YcgR
MSDPKNLRSEERKRLHCPITVLFRDAPALTGKAIDISSKGISMVLPEALEQGKECLVTFEATVAGNKYKVAVRANPVYSIYSGDSFRTGFKFERVDEATSTSIRALYKALFI